MESDNVDAKYHQSVFVLCKLPTLNEYIAACRANKYHGAKLKRNSEQLVYTQTLEIPQITKRVKFKFTWFEDTKKRDPDNVAFAKKFILDALQQNGKIPNDNAMYVAGFEDHFVYGDGQGVLIEIVEVD